MYSQKITYDTTSDSNNSFHHNPNVNANVTANNDTITTINTDNHNHNDNHDSHDNEIKAGVKPFRLHVSRDFVFPTAEGTVLSIYIHHQTHIDT